MTDDPPALRATVNGWPAGLAGAAHRAHLQDEFAAAGLRITVDEGEDADIVTITVHGEAAAILVAHMLQGLPGDMCVTLQWDSATTIASSHPELAVLAAGVLLAVAERPDVDDVERLATWLGDVPAAVGSTDLHPKRTLAERLLAIACGAGTYDDNLLDEVMRVCLIAIDLSRQAVGERTDGRIDLSEEEQVVLDVLADTADHIRASAVSDEAGVSVANTALGQASLALAELRVPSVVLEDLQTARTGVAAAHQRIRQQTIMADDTPCDDLHGIVVAGQGLADQKPDALPGAGDRDPVIGRWAAIAQRAITLASWKFSDHDPYRDISEVQRRCVALAEKVLADSVLVRGESTFDHVGAGRAVSSAASELTTSWLDAALGFRRDRDRDRDTLVDGAVRSELDIDILERIAAQAMVAIAATLRTPAR